PNCPPGSTFYFDVAEDGYYQNQFADFFSVGSMPESTALAMYYNLDRSDIIYITSLDELLHNLSEGTSHLDTTYSFVYGRNGLVDTTNYMRIALTEPEGEVFAGMPVDISAELTIAIDSEKLTKLIDAAEEKFSRSVDVDEFVNYLKA